MGMFHYIKYEVHTAVKISIVVFNIVTQFLLKLVTTNKTARCHITQKRRIDKILVYLFIT
jgi:hypothetical protein